MRVLVCLAILAFVHGAPVDNAPADVPAPQEEPALEAEAPVPVAEAPAPDAIVEAEAVPDPEPPVSVVNEEPEKPAAEPEKPEAEAPEWPAAPDAPALDGAPPEPPTESFSEAHAPEAPATESPNEWTLPPHLHPYTIPEDGWIIPSQPEYNPKPETTFIDELLWALFGDEDDDDPRLERFSGAQAISSPTSYAVKPIKAEGAAVFMLYAD